MTADDLVIADLAASEAALLARVADLHVLVAQLRGIIVDFAMDRLVFELRIRSVLEKQRGMSRAEVERLEAWSGDLLEEIAELQDENRRYAAARVWPL